MDERKATRPSCLAFALFWWIQNAPSPLPPRIIVLYRWVDWIVSRGRACSRTTRTRRVNVKVVFYFLYSALTHLLPLTRRQSSLLPNQEEEDVKPDLAILRGEVLAEGTDKQAWKKQQRMIRNRESAALSRKRKRDRIESLEQQVTSI